MKCNVIYDEVKTFVNEKKQTVSAKIDCSIDLTKFSKFDEIFMSDEISEKLYDQSKEKFYFLGYNVVPHINNYNPVIQFTVSAKAKVNKDSSDVFDEERGKHIAISKAQLKAMKVANVIYQNLAQALFNILFDDYKETFNKLCDYKDNCLINSYHIKDHIFDLSK